MLKQFGAIYLILGTCIAGGLLGLPIVTASQPFWVSTSYVLCAWLLMTVGAWCLLQVNLWLPPGTNLLSMANATLGRPAKHLTWVIYLALLYTLICAYLAACGDLCQSGFHALGLALPRYQATLLATLIISTVVYQGIRSIDLINRVIMTIKILIFSLLVAWISPHAHFAQLPAGKAQFSWSTGLTFITAFGYAIIIPSIREYLDSHRQHLNRVILIGSIVPMTLYLLWIAVIHAALPHTGPNGLAAMNHSPNTNSLLMHALVNLTHHAALDMLSVLFISICSITGLLGVSLCLVDFLADGLNLAPSPARQVKLLSLTFAPPMIIVLAKPSLFIAALTYAGAFCLYILIALPIVMYLVGRHRFTPST